MSHAPAIQRRRRSPLRLYAADLAELMALHREAAGIVDVTFVLMGDADLERRANSGDRQARAHLGAMLKLIAHIRSRPRHDAPNCTICRSVFDRPPALFAVIAAHEQPSVYIARGICSTGRI
jgi:hypothetical protein